MSDSASITLFHAPNTRSSGVLILLEELAAPYELRVLNIRGGEQRQSAYLAINPLGKVPAIVHGGVLVTEQVAIFIYLADLYPERRLAPALSDPLRGPYLRWLVFYAACYEPALIDVAQKREPGPTAMSPYGSFEVVLETVIAELTTKPYLLGDEISAADILWASALRWGSLFGLVPPNAIIAEYIARVGERPAVKKVADVDAALAAGSRPRPASVPQAPEPSAVFHEGPPGFQLASTRLPRPEP